jgi:hypothetical protein
MAFDLCGSPAGHVQGESAAFGDRPRATLCGKLHAILSSKNSRLHA